MSFLFQSPCRKVTKNLDDNQDAKVTQNLDDNQDQKNMDTDIIATEQDILKVR